MSEEPSRPARFRWRDPVADGMRISGLRAALRTWAVGRGLTAEFVDDVVLATYEAAANAVEHGNRGRPGPVTVTATHGPGGIEVRICDGGRWRRGPGPRTTGRGNGLALMHGLCDRCAVDGGRAGTTVTLWWTPETVRAAYRPAPGGR